MGRHRRWSRAAGAETRIGRRLPKPLISKKGPRLVRSEAGGKGCAALLDRVDRVVGGAGARGRLSRALAPVSVCGGRSFEKLLDMHHASDDGVERTG